MDGKALEVYLIGKPQSGKTTAFAALTGETGGNPRRVTKVPDPRLDRLWDIFQPERKTFAEIVFCDIFAQRAAELAGRHADRFTAALGEADMLAVTVQCFGEMDANGDPVDPVKSLDAVFLELVLADLGVVARRLERIAADLKRGQKQLLPEQAILERCLAQLESEQPLSRLTLSEEESRLLRGFQLLSLKPAIILANASEDEASQPVPAALADYAASRGLHAVAFCAQLEAEIAGLEPAEQLSFLADYQISQPARDQVIRACYDSLDLISFLTGGGKDEVRAWPIPRGFTAAQAAGTIHTDFERGFIRAETIAFTDLDRLGTVAKCRDEGLLRLEGRDYVVQDGDFILFRFNV